MNPSFAQILRSRQSILLRSCTPLALLFALTACATLPPPTAELAAAQQAIAHASDADADQHAPDLIGSARLELSQAQVAMADGHQQQARSAALVAAAGGDLAYAQSHARKLEQQHAQRSTEIAHLRTQLGLPGDSVVEIPPTLMGAEAMAPAMRLEALDADPRYAGLAAYERLRARQQVELLAEAKSKQRPAAMVVAARRVEIAELAARSELIERDLRTLEQARSELLVEASRREAERARQEAERLRVQAQIQAEETARLRAAAEAETQAREQAEAVILDVGGEQAAQLKAARQREAELARQEAELMAAQAAGKAAPSPPAAPKPPKKKRK
ncbi:MAG: DUF4398 domain-containing protein [Luteimonas sp.]